MTLPNTLPLAMELDPPYFAVIFSSARKGTQDDGYEETAARMVELAAGMPGFLGVESARNSDGFGITVSYWKTEKAIAQWRTHAEHLLAQERGKTQWYRHYILRIAKVERCYSGPEGR